MNKLLAVIAATFLALSAIASGAEAGFNVRINAPAGFSEVQKAGCGGGGGGYSRSYRRSAYQSVRRSKRRVEVASRSVSKPAVVAKAEVEPATETVEKVADVENSSISTAPEKVAELTAEPKAVKKTEQKVAVAKEIGCKKFFATVGMTLSVPCE